MSLAAAMPAHFRVQCRRGLTAEGVAALTHSAWEHPVLLGVGGIGAGVVAITWSQVADLHPKLKALISILSGFAMLLSLLLAIAAKLYSPARTLWDRMMRYTDAEKGAAAETQRMISSLRGEVGLMKKDLEHNTRLTNQVSTDNHRTQELLLQDRDVREIVTGIESQVSGVREDFRALGVTVDQSFKRLRDDFNGLGKSLRSEMSDLRERLKSHDERLDRLESDKKAP